MSSNYYDRNERDYDDRYRLRDDRYRRSQYNRYPGESYERSRSGERGDLSSLRRDDRRVSQSPDRYRSSYSSGDELGSRDAASDDYSDYQDAGAAASIYGGRAYDRSNYSRGYGRGYGSDYRRSYNRDYSDDYGPYSRGAGYGRSYDRDYADYDYRDRYSRNERGWWDRMSDEVASWFGDQEAERRRQLDESREGRFRGKGPRGYKRSDERIKEDVNDRLTDHAYLDASDIEVAVLEGEIFLSGSVPNRWAKRTAEDIAESVSGVSNVQNNLKVGRTTVSETQPEEPAASKARVKSA